MKIELKEISVRELINGYEDNQENGVVGYGGKLDIRPPYQREFIYKDKQREAVIDTITKDFPLNVMYWSVREWTCKNGHKLDRDLNAAKVILKEGLKIISGGTLDNTDGDGVRSSNTQLSAKSEAHLSLANG